MAVDLTPYFRQYEALAAQAEQAFEKVKKDHPECVKCKVGCSDCCFALFDLTLIEALYINHHFNRRMKTPDREKLLEKADKTDRQIYKIKKKAVKDKESGKSENDILAEMAAVRMRCPLLNEEDRCCLYEHRPVTCRLYGIPTAIAGVGHTCGLSGFVKGRPYSTVNLDVVQSKLYEISDKLVKEIKSRHIKMGEILVPLSMALITEYSEAYLGLVPEEDKGGQNG